MKIIQQTKTQARNYFINKLSIVCFLLFSYIQLVRSISNCFAYNNDNSICLKCQTGYVVDWFGKQCVEQTNSQPNCVQISPYKDCVRCDCGYALSLDTSTCVQVSNLLIGCEVLRNESECIRPKKDYFMREEGGQFIIKYSEGIACEILDFNGVCRQCHSGYSLDENLKRCVTLDFSIDNEFFTIAQNGIFRSRDFRFERGDKGVYPIIQNCASYSSNNDNFTAKCLKCTTKKIFNQSQNKCFKSPISFCAKVADIDPNICVECENNDYFYLYTDSSNKQGCVPRHNELYDGCEERFTVLSKCKKCKSNFIWSNGQCLANSYQVPIKRDLIDGCMLYLDENTCQQCLSQLSLTTNGQCIQNLDLNCILPNFDGTCYQCKERMYFDTTSKKCIQIEDYSYCVYSDGKTSYCQICSNQYYISQDPSTLNRCIQINNGACLLSQGIENKCVLCYSNYYIQAINSTSNHCQHIDDFDKCYYSHGILNQCKLCKNQYILDSTTKKCVPQVQHNGTNCQIKTFYIQNANDQFCTEHLQQNIMYCVIFDNKFNKCLKCQQNAYIDASGICQKLINCSVTDGRNNLCHQTYDSTSYLDSSNAIIQTSVQCITNRREDICTTCSINGYRGIYYQTNCISINSLLNNVGKNCLHLTLDSNGVYLCDLCENTYYLDVLTSSCLPINIFGCILSDGRNNICLVCSSFYTYNSITNECDLEPAIIQIPYCIEQSFEKCKKCENLFYVDTSFQCSPISPINCSKSDGIIDKCLECANNLPINYFVLEELYCGIPNCSQYNPTTKLCDTCESGFILNEKQDQCIIDIDPNCKIYTIQSMCSQCKDNYFLGNSTQISGKCQINEVPNCKLQKKNCEICQAGYYLKAGQYCVKLDNCEIVAQNNQNVCKKCNDNYYLSSKEYCRKIDNCQVQYQKICQKCNAGYYINSNEECSPIPHCSQSGGVLFQCQTCATGYQLHENYCLPISFKQNCLTYDSSGNCIKCQNLYYLSANSCAKITINNCQNSDGIQNKCLACYLYSYVYDSNNQQCIQAIPNCFMSNGIDACLICNKNYYITQNAIPHSKSSCVARTSIQYCDIYSYNSDSCDFCLSRYYLSNDKKSCLPFDVDSNLNCFYTEGELNNCFQCNKDYYIIQYNTIDGKLKKRCINFKEVNYNQGCALYNFNNSSQCMKCSQNTFYTEPECTPRLSADNCIDYELDQDSCKTCKEEYKLVKDSNIPFKSICLPLESNQLVPNCQKYDQTTGKCSQCQQNLVIPVLEYYLDLTQNKCIYILNLNCIEYDPTTSSCKQSYFANCAQLDSQKSKCILCNQFYYLSNDKCYDHQIINKCVDYSKIIQNRCDKCQNLYYLDSNSQNCLLISDQYCLESVTNKNQCSKCLQQYSFDENNLCVISNIQFCKSYNTTSKICIECLDGYKLSYDKLKCSEELNLNKYCKKVNTVNQFCELCNDGYLLNHQYECIPTNTRCQVANCKELSIFSSKDQLICSICEEGYTLLDQICYKNDNNDYIQQQSVDGNQSSSFQEVLVVVFIIVSIVLLFTGLAFYWVKARKGKNYSQVNDKSIMLSSIK